MSSPLRQTNFSAGELDPQVQGRSDLPIFGRGTKTMRNFVPLKTGAATSRPGSSFVAEVKSIAQYQKFPGIAEFFPAGEEPARPVRLERFVFADDDTYLLEVGERYIRFHTLGRTLEAPVGTPYEVTTYVAATGQFAGQTIALPIVAADLWKLRFAQVGNIITITGPNFMPLELKRNGTTDWTCSETVFTPPQPVLPDVGDSYFTNPFNPGSVPQNITTTPFVVVESSIGTPDGDHPEREWVHAFTAIMEHRATGAILESAAVVVRYQHADGAEPVLGTPAVLTELTTQKFPIYLDMPLTLKRLAALTGPDPAYRTLGFRMYRGRGDVLGWIGDTRSREFIDTGEEPNYAIQPPLGFHPFRRTQAASPTTFFETPISVGFFQERRVFGGASYRSFQAYPVIGPEIGRSGTLFFSATGDYFNFDKRLALHIAGEALTHNLASNTRETVRHLVALERLLVLASGSVWTFAGHQGSPLDFDSVNARCTDLVGAGDVTPVVVDGCVLFVRNKGTGARVLVPQDSEEKPYAGLDLSENAKHLVTGSARQLVDWAYQEDPFGIIWAVRKDGALLSLTFDKNRSIVAWARHDSEAAAAGQLAPATYESVCTVPEGEEDAVYVVVQRSAQSYDDAGEPQGYTRQRFIERLTSRVRRVKETDANPENVATPTPADTATLYPTDVCLDCVLTYRGPPTRTFTDLERHAGKSVYVLARGSPPMLGAVNAGGELELSGQVMPAVPAPNAVDENGNPIWVAHIGLLYECDLESLAVVSDVLRTKTLAEVGFELDEAKGIKAGQSFARLKSWKQRAVSDQFGIISAASVLLYTPVDNAWDKTARVCLRQSLPLPVTVVGITREVV